MISDVKRLTDQHQLLAGTLPGEDTEERRAIAVVVIGGQTLVLVLTLVVTPVTYSLFDDLRERRLAVRSLRWFRSRWSAPDPVTPL